MAIPPFIISMWIFIRMFKKFTKKYQDQLAEANSFANEAIGNIRIIKSFATEKKEINQFFSSLSLLYKTGKKKVILYGCFLFFSVLLANGAVMPPPRSLQATALPDLLPGTHTAATRCLLHRVPSLRHRS